MNRSCKTEVFNISKAASNLYTEMQRTVVLLGGSGETGKQVLKELNADPLVSKVILVGRRLLQVDDQPKVDQKVVDFDNLSDHKVAFNGAEIAICCLGTTRGKSGKEGFIKVDHDYVVESAKILKELGTCKDFHLVSSWGAKADSWNLYPQVKGKVEEELKTMGFDRVSIYRPGLLMTDRNELRLMEKMARGIAGVLDKSSKFSISTEVLGKAIVHNALRNSCLGSETFEHAQILNLAQKQ